MIVVAIIGILATIAIPNFQKFQAKARQSEGKGYLSAIYSGEQSFRSEWNSYYSALDSIGVVAGTNVAGQVGACQFPGAGVYRAGFAAVGPLAPSVTIPAGNCATAVPDNAAGGVPIPGVATLPAAAVATVAGSQTFVAGASGNIGKGAGAPNVDAWTINNMKVLTQTQSGL